MWHHSAQTHLNKNEILSSFDSFLCKLNDHKFGSFSTLRKENHCLQNLLFVFGREIEELKRFVLSVVDGIWARSYASNAQINRFFPKRINEDELCRELNCKVLGFFVHSHESTSFAASLQIPGTFVVSQ